MQQPPADKPRDGIPYLGSRISLVSKTDIRYEGFLFNIDTRQSTVALQSVRSFGTEGRRAELVPPSPHVLQYATFKASEIKDLHVCEAAPQGPDQPPQPPQAPPQPPQPSTPAAASKPTLLTPGSVSSAQQQVQAQQVQAQQVQTQQVQAQQVQAQQVQAQQYQQQAQAQQYQQQQAQAQQYQQQAQSQQSQQQSRRQAGNNARTIPGMGGHLLKRKERRAPGGADAAGVGPDTSSGEFNFATGLNDFDKQEEFSKMEESAKQEPKGSYQKSSFFDTISCDALDRLEGQRSRMSGSEERKLNTETFGAVGLNNRRNFRGRGRGRRGGYRSGNWDGGRGGNGGGRGRYNNNNNGFPTQQSAGP